jgi:ribonuclease P protein component
LCGGNDYLRLFKSGRRIRTACFNVYTGCSPAQAPRLGIAVSKRNVARAVDRNRLKRIARESFRLHLDRLPPNDIVVQMNPPARLTGNAELLGMLAAVWGDISRLYPTSLANLPD